MPTFDLGTQNRPSLAHTSLSSLTTHTPAFSPLCTHTHTHTHTPGSYSLHLFTFLLKHMPGTALLEDGLCLVPVVSTWSREDHEHLSEGKPRVPPAQSALLPAELHSSAHMSPLGRNKLTPPVFEFL